MRYLVGEYFSIGCILISLIIPFTEKLFNFILFYLFIFVFIACAFLFFFFIFLFACHHVKK